MRTPVLANKPTILIFVYCYGTSTASPICKMGQEEQREHGTKGICWHIVFGTLHISDARKGQVPRAHILHGITKKKPAIEARENTSVTQIPHVNAPLRRSISSAFSLRFSSRVRLNSLAFIKKM